MKPDRHTPDRHRPDRRTEERVHEWLVDGTDMIPDHVLRDVTQELDSTPQSRRRLLGRWLDRDEGARRRTDDHDHTPADPRRTRLMFSATGIVAAFAVLALTVNIVGTQDTQPPAAGSGATHVVALDGSGDYGTIAEAVEAAVNGDTVLVQPGTYVESIFVDKDITISGVGDRSVIILKAPPDGPVFTGGIDGPVEVRASRPADASEEQSWEAFGLLLLSSDATISTLTLTGDTTWVVAFGGRPVFEDLVVSGIGEAHTGAMSAELSGEPSMAFFAGSDAIIRGSRFENGGPIAVFGGSDATIEGNELVDGPHIHFGLESRSRGAIIGNRIGGTIDHAIGLFAPTTMTIEGNIIETAGGDGISVGVFPALGVGFDPLIRDNLIEASGVGIDVAPGARPTIEANTVSGGSMGINLEPDADAAISGNELVGNRTAIRLTGSNATISGNQLVDNVGGILISGGAPSLEGNEVSDGSTGIVISGTSTAPTLTGNTVCGNKKNLVIAAGAEQPDLAGNEICEDAPVG